MKAARTKPQTPSIHYTVSMPDPTSHTFHVDVHAHGVGSSPVLAFPVWTPGSYKLREFGKNVSGFAVKGGQHELLDKQRYAVAGAKGGEFRASFRVYADELSVRTPHLDETHGFFLGTNLLPFLEGSTEGLPAACVYDITIQPWRNWQVATSLPSAGKNTWRAAHYDILGDTPFEIGTHKVRSFKVRGVRHDVAFYGYGNFDAARIVADTAKVVGAQAKLFGGLPYDRYLFIHHITPDSGGGLEHLNSCVCGWNSWKFKEEEDYQAFIRLVSHEFFHAWNVKRTRPAVLGPFNYSREQYTRALWVMEGLTQYYERIWCARAGVTKPERVLRSFAENIEREDRRPGRKVMSLEDASWLAWTKLYLADEDYVNTGVSYYSRGAQVGLLLDAKIRALTGGARNLDHVMKLAFQRFGWPKPGFAERGFEALCEEVAGQKLTRFWRDHVQGTRELKYDEFLDVYGLEFHRENDKPKPWLGLTLSGNRVSAVFADGPGRKAGLQARDEIIAVNSNRTEGKALDDRLAELPTGKPASLAVFRRQRLVQAEITPQPEPASALQLRQVKKPTAAQKRNFKSWLGVRI
ncbi:MAG: M61 family metallopeptidase [Planctomycetes bacterium]|nr:M61 family metallopeptidase [Planctomycetota bacterium]